MEWTNVLMECGVEDGRAEDVGSTCICSEVPVSQRPAGRTLELPLEKSRRLTLVSNTSTEEFKFKGTCIYCCL